MTIKELRQQLQDIWISTSGVKLDAKEIDETLALIDRIVERVIGEDEPINVMIEMERAAQSQRYKEMK